MAYNWLLIVPVTSATNLCGVSAQAACYYYSYFENLVADLVAEHQEKIGGQGIIVEVGKSKFGERKYHLGHQVIGTKILGVLKEQRKNVFLPFL